MPNAYILSFPRYNDLLVLLFEALEASEWKLIEKELESLGLTTVETARSYGH